MRNILIVDANEAFATMLKQALEQDGEYGTTVSPGGDDALQALGGATYDLAIVDLGVADPDGVQLAREMREQQADLRLVLIPLDGDELPPEAADLDVQGVLPKPFFFPELAARVAAALGEAEAEVPSAPAPIEAAPQAVAPAPGSVADAAVRPLPGSEERLAALREHLEEVVREMRGLSQEVSAEAVILTCGERLIAHAGRLSAEEADRLAQVAGESWRTSARMAQILGREQLRFEQSVEGGEYLFYSLGVAEDIILSAALSADVPLGMIRHRAKSTADAIQALMR